MTKIMPSSMPFFQIQVKPSITSEPFIDMSSKEPVGKIILLLSLMANFRCLFVIVFCFITITKSG